MNILEGLYFENWKGCKLPICVEIMKKAIKSRQKCVTGSTLSATINLNAEIYRCNDSFRCQRCGGTRNAIVFAP